MEVNNKQSLIERILNQKLKGRDNPPRDCFTPSQCESNCNDNCNESNCNGDDPGNCGICKLTAPIPV